MQKQKAASKGMLSHFDEGWKAATLKSAAAYYFFNSLKLIV